MRRPPAINRLVVIATVVLTACEAETRLPVAPRSPPGSANAPSPALAESVDEDVGWWNDAIFYEVFVRSFCDSDGDGIGDLPGLTKKLDYLSDGDPETGDDLGITGIWLMPIMESPSYHGYDLVDYFTVDHDYGTNEAFRTLVGEAHERGVRIIVDLVLNHTSWRHPWFVNASQGPEAQYRDWYIWRRESPDYVGPWGQRVWHSHQGNYYYALFWRGMPDLNYRNPKVTEASQAIARFWLEEMGADGFRLDAAHHLVEEGQTQAGTPGNHRWWAEFDELTDKVGSDVLTVGEIWADTSAVAPYIANDELDLAFEFNLASAIISSINGGDPGWFKYVLHQVEAGYPAHQYATFLTNHDQNRVMSQLRQDSEAARLAATVLLTLPGTPFIYYGEELGMTGQKPDEMIRTPMQWTAEAHAGFTTGRPWQAVNAGYEKVNVATAAADPDSLLNHYRRLIQLRHDHPALSRGDLVDLESTCGHVHGYLRHHAGEYVLTILNFGAQEQADCAFTLPASGLAPGDYTVQSLLMDLGSEDVTVNENGGFTGYVPTSILPPRGADVLLLGQGS
ncbi:MAG: alpha-amylase family glycosyl hydrolase [Anaerolineae bacterium]|jgi:glycosidase